MEQGPDKARRAWGPSIGLKLTLNKWKVNFSFKTKWKEGRVCIDVHRRERGCLQEPGEEPRGEY